MNKEDLILERLERIEAQLAPLLQTADSFKEIKKDLTPIVNHAVQVLVKELEDVESSFQLEDLQEMIKQFLRSVKNITYSLRQLQNFIDFVTTAEPLLKSSVPQLINYLDDMEQRGVFRVLNAALGIRAKIATEYTPEDIEQIGDGLVALLGLAKKITNPQTLSLLEGLVDMPSKLDLATCKDIGPFGLLMADKEVKVGLGVLVELTKRLGKLKGTVAQAGVPS